MLSVIVPVYNCEKLIKKCILSILSQTYTDIEIIVIDDGSNDRTGVICDELALTDRRIHVYHTDNKGSVSARCLGIENATGNLITFVDADDWIEPDMYENMLYGCEQLVPDIISSGLIYDYENRTVQEIDTIDEGIYENEDIDEKIMSKMMYDTSTGCRAITPSICTKIFCNKLLLAATESIDRNIKYGGDAAISYLCFAMAKRIKVINAAWYHYCIRQDSLIHSYNIESFNKILLFKEYMKKSLMNMGRYEMICEQLNEYTKIFLIQAVKGVYGIDIEQPRYLFPFEMIERNSRIVIYGGGNVGKSYYNNIQRLEFAEIVAWVDKKYQTLNGLRSPDEIETLIYDYIVIAIDNEFVANEVRLSLMNKGICCHKIVWKKPIII